MAATPANLMLRSLSLAICLLASATHVRSEEVSLELKGIDLLANLELAQGKSLKKNGVMLIVHNTLSHNRSEFISPLQQNLQMGGINTLAITLSLGLDRRNGPYPCSLAQDVRNSDAVEEIEAWVGWLRSQNVRSITLAGHGWGGDQIARYALAKNNPDNAPDAAPKKSKKKAKKKPKNLVQKLVLIEPAMRSQERNQENYPSFYQAPLQPILLKARQLAEKNEGYTLMNDVGFLSCIKTRVTANAFLDFYSPQPGLLTRDLLSDSQIPTLILSASLNNPDPVAGQIDTVTDHPNLTYKGIIGPKRKFGPTDIPAITAKILAFLTRKR